MADPEATHDDILAFMDDDERMDWDSGKGTPEERNQRLEDLKALWRSIPDPTDEELQPPYMPHDTWQTYQSGGNREGIRNFYVRKWKQDRKAAAREKQAEQSKAAKQSEIDVPTPDKWQPNLETTPPPLDGGMHMPHKPFQSGSLGNSEPEQRSPEAADSSAPRDVRAAQEAKTPEPKIDHDAHHLAKEVKSQETVHQLLDVFLCHSSDDKSAVRALHQRLIEDGVRPWLDQEDLLPGQDWNMEIRRAVRNSHVVIVCLSERSITKAGYVQKEIREALDVADEQPEGTIFIIPLRLEECDVPERLRRWQWVDYFEPNGHERLIRALRARAETLGLSLVSTPRLFAVPHHGIRREPAPIGVPAEPVPPRNAAKRLSDALARAQRNQAKASSEQDRVARFAHSARLKGPEEFEQMEQLFQERVELFNKSDKPKTVPDINYDSRRHLLDGKKFGVSIDILIGQVYELRVFVGLHPDAAQFMAELPDVEVTRWHLRASEDESGFFWYELNEGTKFSSEEIVDASIDALTDLLAADM